MATKAKSVPVVEFTVVEETVARGRIALNRKTALARGWESVTPEVLEFVKADDQRRINALTQKLLAEHS